MSSTKVQLFILVMYIQTQATCIVISFIYIKHGSYFFFFKKKYPLIHMYIVFYSKVLLAKSVL